MADELVPPSWPTAEQYAGLAGASDEDEDDDGLLNRQLRWICFFDVLATSRRGT
jgi:hypothetical protein